MDLNPDVAACNTALSEWPSEKHMNGGNEKPGNVYRVMSYKKLTVATKHNMPKLYSIYTCV